MFVATDSVKPQNNNHLLRKTPILHVSICVNEIEILHLLLFIGTRNGHHCSHDQYHCKNQYYGYYNIIIFDLDCINSTLVCNGKFDCSFSTSDEQGCGMLPKDIDD